MAVKEFDARTKNKRDTSDNWEANDPVLLDGEIIVVDTASGAVRKKVGNGTSKYSELPFDDDEIRTALKGSSVEVTLAANAWVDGKQTITIDGLTADHNGIIGISQTITDAQLAAVQEAKMYVSGQSDGAMTIAVNGETPSCDIPATIILFG